MEQAAKKQVIESLREQILSMQGYKTVSKSQHNISGLELFAPAFPGSSFPLQGSHEFISESQEQTAASSGFISGILSALMKDGSPCIWISASRKFFPPATKRFSLNAASIIFIDLQNEKELLWVTEEALKCEGLAAVVSEIPDLNFATSRRFQLVIEKSKVTALFLRENPRILSNTTCLARWKISPLPSILPEGMPGVGQPSWKAELLKVRNGEGGTFEVCWSGSTFEQPQKENTRALPIHELQTG
ncbi:Error-prone repair protein ImuA [Pedobacter riviphilus]|uniref:Error-prone repair protein ImuA n=1 Tax=Pedobacter riviphilus TaxID=2766984 RepID=A0ABX6TQ95_9SPHI|nr:Error-prone repair protein ImuA [Pedobacter riviphilus]QNR86765.1 Error-prone repair protein ImuA [Pedobacter riviphilus]